MIRPATSAGRTTMIQPLRDADLTLSTWARLYLRRGALPPIPMWLLWRFIPSLAQQRALVHALLRFR